MNLIRLLFGIAVLLVTCTCSSIRTTHHSSYVLTDSSLSWRKDFKKYFDDCHTAGSIVIYDQQKQQWIVSDTIAINQATLPASTFKIINMLIALETQTIQSENDTIRWPGTTDTVKYGYRPDIYRDISVREAFEISAGWAFVEMSKTIGKASYKKYLTASNYGNVNLSQKDPDFWNFGDFAISPLNQVQFLQNLHTENLPFAKEHIASVKNVMLTESTTQYRIYAKTGWTRDGDVNTGWWVGYLENQNGTYIFATRLLQDRKENNPNFGSCRKDITKAVFRDLGLI